VGKDEALAVAVDAAVRGNKHDEWTKAFWVAMGASPRRKMKTEVRSH